MEMEGERDGERAGRNEVSEEAKHHAPPLMQSAVSSNEQHSDAL